MMGIDLNNPFYQQVMSQGQALGYGPMAIAAAIGNASIENGGKTSGAPGDTNVADGLGGAYGGFQWRGPRFDNLKTLASQDGTSWTDPATQAKYFWGEVGGKYPNAGVGGHVAGQLKDAQDLDTANDAMVDFEKPGGWKGGDNNSQTVPTYAARLAAAQTAYSAMQKAGLGGPVDPDAPAPGATPVAGQGTPPDARTMINVGNYTRPQQTAQPIQAPATSMGQRLMMAGAALMARDNPAGASALSGMVSSERNNDLQTAQLMASQQKQQNATPTWKDQGTVGDGKYRLQTDDLGNQRYVPVPQDAQDTTEDAKAKKADVLQFQTNADTLSNQSQLINTANLLKDHLLKGDLNVSIDKQGLATIQNYSGRSAANGRDLKNMEALINIQIRNILAMEKGPATDMKMKQALQQVLPSGGQWDNAQVYDALDRMTDQLRGTYSNAANTNRAYSKMYPGLVSDAHGVDGKPIDPGQHYDDNLQYWQGQQDDFDSRKGDFLKRHDAAAQSGNAKPGFLNYYDNH